MWRDAFLKWNKTQYGGVTKLPLPQSMVWTPHDVTAVNTYVFEKRIPEIHNVDKHNTIMFFYESIFVSYFQLGYLHIPIDVRSVSCT